MGCGASKSDTVLVKLCRERKELIRAARDSLDSLDFSHTAYLQSMQNLESELKNFMEVAIAICFNLNSDAGLVHPPMEALPNNTNEDDDGLVHPPLKAALNNTDEDDDDDHLSLNIDVNAGLNPPETQPENVSGQVQPSDNLGYNHHKETPIGVTAYSVPNTSDSEVLLNGAPSGSQTDGAFVMDIPSDNAEHYQTLFSHPSEPLQHEASTWDYINPFNVVENSFHIYYSRGGCDVSSVRDDMDLRELWMREEGMPDLEGGFDVSIMDDTSIEDLEECLSEAADIKNGDGGYPDQKEEVKSTGGGVTNIRHEEIDGTGKEDLECGPISPASEISKAEEIKESLACDGEEEHVHKEMERSKPCENLDSSSKNDVTLPELMSNVPVNSPRDLQEVLNEIKDGFDDIIVHGKGVSMMLSPYEPVTAVNKGYFPFGIERLAATSSETSARRSTDRMLKMAKESGDNLEKDTRMTSSYNLSLTLEKLCLWENKLYEEVKNEEKLREDFDKGWRRLKKLDDNGAEPSKLEACQSALIRLTPRINVSIITIERIAARAHKVRDEELHPQLCQLIQRMQKMWKLMFESHKKQVCAITKLQANVETTCTPNDSSLKATKKLETGIQNLGSAFSNWIKRHRAFPLLLNNWLSKFLLQEEGKSPGAASPSVSPPTPTVFAICTHWHKAVETVSEANVLCALNNFRQLVHELFQNMHEEVCQKTKIEHLSSYHEKRLRNFCVQNGLDWDQCTTLIREFDSNVETGSSPFHVLYMNLKPIRINLSKANAIHEEVIERIRVGGGSILQNGLAPLLEALQGFSLEMSNAFEQVSAPS